MTLKNADGVSDRICEIAAGAWTFRWHVELEAAQRFGHLGRRLSSLQAPAAIIALAHRAAADEVRHAEHCLDLAQGYGATHPTPPRPGVPELAPRGLTERQRVLYEVVAVGCVTETESTSVLTSLLTSVSSERLRPILRELAADEVFHSRFGWAHLAWERNHLDTGFLSRWIPVMLEAAAGPELFGPSSPAHECPELLMHGVVPRTMKRNLFAQTCRDVIFPGLSQFGVDTAFAHAWLNQKLLDPPIAN